MNVRKLLDWKTLLIYVHRWTGCVFGIVFVVWFASGVAMMYVRMPNLSTTERLGHVSALNSTALRISPAEAARLHGIEPTRVRLESYYDGRPIYRFDPLTRIYADTGELVGGVDRDAAMALVRRWVPEQYATAVRYDAYLVESDQWTLYTQHRNLMPLHRIAVGDPAGTVYYVSELTGEPVMKTDRRGRSWGYISAVLHWTYFTSFRLNGPLWLETVAWGSLAGAVMCVLGIVVGFVRLRVKGRYRLRSGPSHSPYTGWMKWHHYAGLIFGIVTITWAFSGAVTLGRPFPNLRNGPNTPEQRMAVAGAPLELEALTVDRLRRALDVVTTFAPKDVEIHQFRGEPYLIAYRPPSGYSYEAEIGANEARTEGRREHLIVSILAPERGPFRRFSDDQMWDVAKAAMPSLTPRDAEWLREYDAYYYDQAGARPLPVLRVRYADAASTWLYLDPHLGTMTKQDSGGRWNRWLYHGLHSLDFPFLYYRRPLWDIVLIVLSLGGIALSATTLLPSWQRLARHARRLRSMVAGLRSTVNRQPSAVTASARRGGQLS